MSPSATESTSDTPHPDLPPEATDTPPPDATGGTADTGLSGSGDQGPTPLGLQAKIGVAVLVVAALAALFWPRGESSFEAPGGFLVDGDGRPVKLANRMAPVTLVHFWATWCAPCITEIPALQQLAEDFADEPDFDLVMIAVDDEPAKVEPFLGTLAPMALYDPNWEVANRYGTEKLPETYLVIGGQQVIEVPSQSRLRRQAGLSLSGDAPRWVGQTDWGDPELRRELRSLLDQLGSGAVSAGAG